MRGLLLVWSLHFGGPEHPGGDSWFAPDKAKHFFTAAFVQTLAFGALRSTGLSHRSSLVGATLVSSGVSIGKELHDRASGSFISEKDLTWDAAGIVAASALLHRAER